MPTFQEQGNREGFGDPTKGTIFFHIKQIINRTRPKVIFLENVQNIISHDKGKTIHIIIDSLERKLNYKVIGISHDKEGSDSLIRKIVLYIAENFGNNVVLEKLDFLEESIMSPRDDSYISIALKYNVLSKDIRIAVFYLYVLKSLLPWSNEARVKVKDNRIYDMIEEGKKNIKAGEREVI